MPKGRRPKPSHLRMVEGNRGRRPLNENEPQPKKGRPKIPTHLSVRARSAWKFVAELLDNMGVLTEADSLALERLCETYVEIVEAQELIEKKGRVYKTHNEAGEIMWRSHPAVKQLQDADRRFRAYLIEFGLTPAARSKVQTSGGKKKDPLEDYFGS